MEILKVSEVFTPASPAKYTFVERESDVNDLLVDSLSTQGKQIIIYGHTGCGKTTLLLNKLNQLYEGFIITRCMQSMSFESIILDGFDQLGVYYVDEREVQNSNKSASGLGVEYLNIKLQIEAEKETISRNKSKRILPPQLTPQRLAKFFGKKKCCWVLEDFHKVNAAEKSKASQMMKVFMDTSYEYPELKIIAIGAVGTGREVVEYDSEMNGRVAEILVPLMKDKEILSIIRKGEELLGIKFSTEVRQNIIRFSSGLASVCHQLCLNICFSKNIYYTRQDWPTFSKVDLDEAIKKYLVERADTFKAQFDKATKITQASTFNLPKEVLRTIIEIDSDEFTFQQVYTPIKALFRTVPETAVKRILEELQTVQRSELLFMDPNSNKYYFSSQFSKVYIALRFEEEKSQLKEKITLKEREEKRIQRLFEIIERDFLEDEKRDQRKDMFTSIDEIPEIADPSELPDVKLNPMKRKKKK